MAPQRSRRSGETHSWISRTRRLIWAQNSRNNTASNIPGTDFRNSNFSSHFPLCGPDLEVHVAIAVRRKRRRWHKRFRDPETAVTVRLTNNVPDAPLPDYVAGHSGSVTSKSTYRRAP